jgi:transposase-like protein
MSMSVKKKRVTGQPGRPSKYGPEFQRDAVAMVLDQGRSVGDVARSLGVNDGTLSNWVSKQRVARAAGADLGADRVTAEFGNYRTLSVRSCWSEPWGLHSK